MDGYSTDENLEQLEKYLQEIARLAAGNAQKIATVQASADQMKARVQQDVEKIVATVEAINQLNTTAVGNIQASITTKTVMESVVQAIATLQKSDAQALNTNGRRIAEARAEIANLRQTQADLVQLLTDHKQTRQEFRQLTQEVLDQVGRKLRGVRGEG
jgi:chromosome segregation ATPase